MTIGYIGIEAPKLRSVSTEYVRIFLAEWLTYKARIAEWNLQNPEDPRSPVTLYGSMDRTIQKMYSDENDPHAFLEPETVDEDALHAWLSDMVGGVAEIGGIYNLRKQLSSILIWPRSGDLLSRVRELWFLFRRFLDESGMEDVFEGADGAEARKLLCGVLVEAIGSKDLRTRAKRTFQCLSPSSFRARKTLRGIYSELSEAAKVQVREEELYGAREDSKDFSLGYGRPPSKRERQPMPRPERSDASKRPKLSEEEKKRKFGAKYLSPDQRIQQQRSQGPNGGKMDDGYT
jgi:hypothetical protein